MFCTFCSSPSNTNTTVKSAGCTILTINAVHLRVAQSKRSFVTHCLASHPNENSCWLSIKVMRSFHANRKQNTCRLSLRSVIKVRHPVFVSLATFLTVLVLRFVPVWDIYFLLDAFHHRVKTSAFKCKILSLIGSRWIKEQKKNSSNVEHTRKPYGE